MIIAKLLLLALLHIPSGHHYGWNQPHNPHHHRPPVPPCTWVQTNTIGSVPVCVPTA
jgi:hypothetical protein